MQDRTRIAIIIAIVVAVVGLGGIYVVSMVRRTQETLKSFEEVNKGLDEVKRTLDERVDREREFLSANGCDALYNRAMFLNEMYKDLGAQIDSIKVELVQVSPDNLNVVDSLFDANGRGERLYNTFLAFYTQAEEFCVNDSIKQDIQQNARPMREYPTLDEWRTHHFFHVPRVACMAILSKFRSDAAGTEYLVIQDMIARCGPDQH